MEQMSRYAGSVAAVSPISGCQAQETQPVMPPSIQSQTCRNFKKIQNHKHMRKFQFLHIS